MKDYTILRVYKVSGYSRENAVDRMVEGIVTRTEGRFHVKDIIREPKAKPGEGEHVNLNSSDWFKSVHERLDEFGKHISSWEERLAKKK